MNKFPAWLNLLVLVILLAGVLFALPNIYGSVSAVKIAAGDGGGETRLTILKCARQAVIDGRINFWLAQRWICRR